MKIAQPLLDEIVAHALRDAPNECCGLVSARDGEAVAVYAMQNTQASPYRFEIEGLDLLRHYTQFEDEGLELAAIYHSHTRSEPRPSQTDVNFAQQWPGVEWIIVGTAGEEPDVRSWLITGADVTRVDLVVV